MRGLLLVNLGTPDSTAVGDVRRYLAEFLDDPRVLDMNPLGRKLLLNLVILPFRPKRSAAAYREIWGDRGSPLLFHSQDLAAAVQVELGQGWKVVLGMRYGRPSLLSALEELVAAGVTDLVLLPLYPQYASSSTGSTLEHAYHLTAAMPAVPALHAVRDFYDHPAFIEAVAETLRPRLASFAPDKVLFSYHGVPERQVQATDLSPPGAAHCLASPSCCDAICPANRACYRAQCFATTRVLAQVLGLQTHQWEVAFQSRLGRIPWIRPFTDERLVALPGEGIKRLLVLCPSFVSDCLETLEEMGIRGRKDFLEAGGEAYELVPCVNSDPGWARGVARLARERLPDTIST